MRKGLDGWGVTDAICLKLDFEGYMDSDMKEEYSLCVKILKNRLM